MRIIKVINIKCYLMTIIFIFAASYTRSQDNSSPVFTEKENRIINDHFKDYRLLKVTDMDSSTQETIKIDYINQPLFLVRGDFDGNNITDFGCILYHEKKNDIVFTIVINKNNCDYEIVLNEEWKASWRGEGAILLKLNAGEKIIDMNSIEPVDKEITLVNPGIELRFIEKSSTVYYWDKKMNKIISIGTSD